MKALFRIERPLYLRVVRAGKESDEVRTTRKEVTLNESSGETV